MRLTDVHRSSRRWAAWLLGDGWIVRLEQRLASEDDLRRDLAFVELAVPMGTLFSRGGVPQGDVLRTATFNVTLLPAPGGTPQEASLRASELAEMLHASVERGLVINDDAGALVCPPLQIPLWDWTGVPIVGAGREGPDTPPLAFADVQDYSSRPLPDPEDDRLYSVLLTFRCSWWTGGRADFDWPVAVGGVEPTFSP